MAHKMLSQWGLSYPHRHKKGCCTFGPALQSKCPQTQYSGYGALSQSVCACVQKLSSLKHQMRMLDGRMWDLGPDKPYLNMTELWDGEVPEANLE